MKDFINKHLTAILAAAFALIVVIVLAVVLIGGDDKEKNPNTELGTEINSEIGTESTEVVGDVEDTETTEGTETPSTEIPSTEVVTPSTPSKEDTTTSETPETQPTPEPTPQPESTPEPEPTPQPEPDSGNVENGDTNIQEDEDHITVNGMTIDVTGLSPEGVAIRKELANAGYYNPVYSTTDCGYYMLIKRTDNTMEWRAWLREYIAERGGISGAGGGANFCDTAGEAYCIFVAVVQ